MEITILPEDVNDAIDSFYDDEVNFGEFIKVIIGNKLKDKCQYSFEVMSVTIDEDSNIECMIKEIDLNNKE